MARAARDSGVRFCVAEFQQFTPPAASLDRGLDDGPQVRSAGRRQRRFLARTQAPAAGRFPVQRDHDFR